MEAFCLLFAQGVEPIAGNAGWLGAGLLGAVLAWLMFVRWPANDKMTRDLMDLASQERDKEAVARHQMLDAFQQMMNNVELEHKIQLKEAQEFYRQNANLDREFSSKRNDSLIAAIMVQTNDLRNAILAGACKYRPSDVHACNVVNKESK